MVKRERSVVLSGKFTPAEEKCVERQAKKQGMTVSDYVRCSVMASLVLDGDFEAMKLIAGSVRSQLAEKFTRPLVEMPVPRYSFQKK